VLITSKGSTRKILKINHVAVTYRNVRKGMPVGPERIMLRSQFESWISSVKTKCLGTNEKTGDLVWCHRDYVHFPTREMNL
jgi:hypothetical protein